MRELHIRIRGLQLRRTGEAASMIAQALPRHKHFRKLTTRANPLGRIDLCCNKVAAIVLQTLAKDSKRNFPR